jgi:cytochrome c peroxidase
MRIRLLLLLTLVLASCEPAQRYPAPPSTPSAAQPREKEDLPQHWSWMRPFATARDVPIEFVSATNPDWAALPKFWNQKIHPAAGMRTIHLGLEPLHAVVAVAAAEQMEVLRIKVPLGLPDPNPLIPSANPPTFEKWRLGKKLFFARLLRSGTETYACADCHQPARGFADARPMPLKGAVNTLSLINALYNRRQFWDGRAGALEEVVVRSLEDERPAPDAPGRQPAEATHIWGGLVKELARDEGFRQGFETVFGISQPTQDAIAKALATYVRTILSGDSLFDRADAERQRAKAATLSSVHFLVVLDDAALKALGNGKLSKDEAAKQIAHGHELFHGKAHCVSCHGGSLFTDHDYHNLGVSPLDGFVAKRMGRIATVPLGLKEERLMGAYRTPTLRALPRTSRYLHDGRRITLHEVVRFFDSDREQQLGLTDTEIDALVLFLEALDGTPVDPVVAAPGAK